MAKQIHVLVTKIDGTDYSPAKEEWVESDKIDGLSIGNANGATFRYTPSDAAFARSYQTSTAASTIAAAANA